MSEKICRHYKDEDFEWRYYNVEYGNQLWCKKCEDFISNMKCEDPDETITRLKEEVELLTGRLRYFEKEVKRLVQGDRNWCRESTAADRELHARSVTIARLTEENERLRELLYRQIEVDFTSDRQWELICKYLSDDSCKGLLYNLRNSVVALRTRLEAAEGKVERVTRAIDDGEEDGLAAWVVLREIKQIVK